MIEVKGLSLAYGVKNVLQNFSVQISQGSITAIVGSNGAGKSSLLSAIAGELKPQAGLVKISGRDIAELTLKDLAKMRSVAQQSHSYWMAYTVEQILQLGHEELERSHINQVAHDLGIQEIMQQSITSLSGGQLQRVEIARAFMRDVPVVLLDEPFASQDLASQERLVTIFEAERAKGRTIVLVAHRERSSLAWCDQIIDLSQ